ncbi:hypothetical protein J6590_070269 [Homalodisca vitripennis]|nr:hypothetical protein J6590_070269 [Homalodisca vitripennis]
MTADGHSTHAVARASESSSEEDTLSARPKNRGPQGSCALEMYHWRDVENLDAVDWWKHASMRGFVLVKDEQHPVMQAATNLRHEMQRFLSFCLSERSVVTDFHLCPTVGP